MHLCVDFHVGPSIEYLIFFLLSIKYVCVKLSSGEQILTHLYAEKMLFLRYSFRQAKQSTDSGRCFRYQCLSQVSSSRNVSDNRKKLCSVLLESSFFTFMTKTDGMTFQ